MDGLLNLPRKFKKVRCWADAEGFWSMSASVSALTRAPDSAAYRECHWHCQRLNVADNRRQVVGWWGLVVFRFSIATMTYIPWFQHQVILSIAFCNSCLYVPLFARCKSTTHDSRL